MEKRMGVGYGVQFPFSIACNHKLLERLVTLCLLLKRLKTGRGKIKVVRCSLPFYFSPLLYLSRLDNGKYADLRFECVCLKYRKCCGAQRGKERRENKRGSGYAERAPFHEGLEHFVKCYVFTNKKNEIPPPSYHTETILTYTFC